MANQAVFSADYVDLKFLKSRKVAQIVVEIAIENAAAFVAAFGTPDPAQGVPVALARLMPEIPVEEPPKERKRFQDLPLAQQAALRCGEPTFREFLTKSRYGVHWNGDVVELVRKVCDVKTRSDIVEGTYAGNAWKQLNTDYEFWLRHPT